MRRSGIRRVIERQFGHGKVRCLGSQENTAQLVTLFALSSLWLAHERSMPVQDCVRLASHGHLVKLQERPERDSGRAHYCCVGDRTGKLESFAFDPQVGSALCKPFLETKEISLINELDHRMCFGWKGNQCMSDPTWKLSMQRAGFGNGIAPASARSTCQTCHRFQALT